MSAMEQASFSIQRLEDYAALHVIWGNWLDARVIQDGTQALIHTLQQQSDTRFVLFDLTQTQHFSVQHMALSAVEFYETTSHHDWLLIGKYEQVRPCEAILHSLFGETRTRHFLKRDEALAYLQEHDSAPH